MCPLSWSVRTLSFVIDGRYSECMGVGVHPLPAPAWADFTLKMECTPESSHCHSVCTVLCGVDS
jgi:hypothetical protein